MKVTKLGRPDTPDKARAILAQFSRPLDQYPGTDPNATGYRRVTFNGGIFTIGATHTGDMYDVALAHTIAGHSLVIIWGVNDNSVSKAAEIARFLDDADNVCWTALPPPEDLLDRTRPADLRKLAEGKADAQPYWIREGGATTIVTAFARTAESGIPELAAPEVFAADTSLDGAIQADLAAHGFKPGQPYVIVNYRQSGHSGAGNAPALDTGEAGFLQLLGAVSELGLIPVPMGELDPADPQLARTGIKQPKADAHAANLVKYWTWDSVNGYGRRAEARLLRVLARDCQVVAAVGMRSGVTDLLCYAGIPTLVIDIHPIRGTVAKGWQRTLKREAAFRGYKIVSLQQGRDRETATAANWAGAFASPDLTAITKSLALLTSGSLPGQWPQHPTQTAGVAKRAADLYNDIGNRCNQIERGRRQAALPPPPTPVTTSTGKTDNLRALMEENEALKKQGVAPTQTIALETSLREAQEEINLLTEWLTDSFVDKNHEVDQALSDLRDASRLIEKTRTT